MTNIFNPTTAAGGTLVAQSGGPLFGLGCPAAPGQSASLYLTLSETPQEGDTVEVIGVAHVLTGETLRVRIGTQLIAELDPGEDEGRFSGSVTITAGTASAGASGQLRFDTGGGDNLGANHLVSIAAVNHTPA